MQPATPWSRDGKHLELCGGDAGCRVVWSIAHSSVTRPQGLPSEAGTGSQGPTSRSVLVVRGLSSFTVPCSLWSLSKGTSWTAKTHCKPDSRGKLPEPLCLPITSPSPVFFPGPRLTLTLAMPVRASNAEVYWLLNLWE